ncbi:MAG: type II and III secretion system protein family protein, partial [Rhodospirillaceae bacterium]|nr:type II and III secretion system protein family protein [Rhodospirillaceae bacterium]
DLPSGGTLFIAGLIKNNIDNNIDGVPGLKDLPILGSLFRSEAFQSEETELVITMTAYLAKPVSNASRLALPTDGFAPASDIDFYLLGRLHKTYTKRELPAYATPLAGPYGYIME